jgi:SAM-dependent methyltransferase
MFMINDSFLTDWITSPYFPLFYEDQQEQRTNFVEALLETIRPAKNSRILEVGCRTGANSQLIAHHGYDVTGIDLSFKAISKAKEFETETLHFFQHDIRLPFWMNYFDYALNLFTAFGRFVTLREHDNSIRVIAQSLKADGFFVLDYVNVHVRQGAAKEPSEKTIGSVHFKTSQWDDEENFYRKIKVTENGFVKDTFIDKLVKLTPGDFKEMFARQELQVQEVFGDYSFNSYDRDHSPRLIMIAKKTKR